MRGSPLERVDEGESHPDDRSEYLIPLHVRSENNRRGHEVSTVVQRRDTWRCKSR